MKLMYKLPVSISKKVYAIGDIHGNRQSLNDVLDWVIKDNDPDKQIIFLGDIIDRGPDSFGCVKDIMDLKNDHNVIVLRGNHEILAELGIKYQDVDYGSCWLSNGGGNVIDELGDIQGLNGFNVSQLLIEKLNPLFEICQNHHMIDDMLFVHAGVSRQFNTLHDALSQSYHIPMKFLDEFTHWAWTRACANSSLSESWFGKFIVHGHTPVQNFRTKTVYDQIKNWHLNLDYGSGILDDGFVNCAVIENNQMLLFKELN